MLVETRSQQNVLSSRRKVSNDDDRDDNSQHFTELYRRPAPVASIPAGDAHDHTLSSFLLPAIDYIIIGVSGLATCDNIFDQRMFCRAHSSTASATIASFSQNSPRPIDRTDNITIINSINNCILSSYHIATFVVNKRHHILGFPIPNPLKHD